MHAPLHVLGVLFSKAGLSLLLIFRPNSFTHCAVSTAGKTAPSTPCSVQLQCSQQAQIENQAIERCHGALELDPEVEEDLSHRCGPPSMAAIQHSGSTVALAAMGCPTNTCPDGQGPGDL